MRSNSAFVKVAIRCDNLALSNSLAWFNITDPFLFATAQGMYQLPSFSCPVSGKPRNEFFVNFLKTSTGRSNDCPFPNSSSPMFSPIWHHHTSPSLKLKSLRRLRRRMFTLHQFSSWIIYLSGHPRIVPPHPLKNSKMVRMSELYKERIFWQTIYSLLS